LEDDHEFLTALIEVSACEYLIQGSEMQSFILSIFYQLYPIMYANISLSKQGIITLNIFVSVLPKLKKNGEANDLYSLGHC
jgi:hypothetical protein